MKAAKPPATMVLTAPTLADLKVLVQDMIDRGWDADSEPSQNPDGSYSITMSKNIA